MDSTADPHDRHPPRPGKLAGLLILECGIGCGFLNPPSLLGPDGCQRGYIFLVSGDGLPTSEFHALIRSESDAFLGPEQEWWAMRRGITTLSFFPRFPEMLIHDPNRQNAQDLSANPGRTIEKLRVCARILR